MGQPVAFYKVKGGFLMGHWRDDNETVMLSEGQAKYLLLSGSISRTAKTVTVPSQPKPAFVSPAPVTVTLPSILTSKAAASDAESE